MNETKNPKPAAGKLSEFVRRAMRQKGLSVRDIQQRAGGPQAIAASYISRIVNARVTNLSVDKLVVLADGLGVDPFELFAAASARPEPVARGGAGGVDALELIDTMQRAVGNPASLEVVRRWLSLGPDYQSAVLNWMRFLSDEAGSGKRKPGRRKRKKR